MIDYTSIPPNPLTNLSQQIRAHWARYRPKMFAEMEVGGTLEAAIDHAARQTEEAVFDYVSRNSKEMNPAQAFFTAWEIFREEWAFLPAEEGFAEDDEDEEEPYSLYHATMRARAAEAQVEDIWDEKNERYITPFAWDMDKEELVPTGEWNDETEEWTPYPGFEYLNPPLESEGENHDDDGKPQDKFAGES
jgi:hypothetical protein